MQLSTAFESVKALLSGKLFRDNRQAFTRLALGVAVAASTTVLLGHSVAPWIAAAAGGAAGGFLQPLLFKNVKYA